MATKSSRIFPADEIRPVGNPERHHADTKDEALAIWKKHYRCIDPACWRPDQPHAANIERNGVPLVVFRARLQPDATGWELYCIVALQQPPPPLRPDPRRVRNPRKMQ